MRFDAPTWQGAHAGLAQKANAANADLNAGMGLKYALWTEKQRHRDTINALLRKKAAEEAQKKAAKKKSGFLGLGGAAVGAGVGALLAPATGGLSLLASASLGAGIGSTAGGAVDQAMGNDGSGGMALGRTLTDFSTEFLPTKPNVFYEAAMQGNSGMSTPGSELMYDQYGGAGFAMPPNRAEY
mgnify:CR=1 FL=1